SQEPHQTSYQPWERDIGHGCGHNLLGTSSFAAACATKAYLEENNLPGTVKFFGCPGEEGGSGKDVHGTGWRIPGSRCCFDMASISSECHHEFDDLSELSSDISF